MSETSRSLTKVFLKTQASLLGIDLSVIDADALLERVASGLADLDRSDEILTGDDEPAVTFNAGRDDK